MGQRPFYPPDVGGWPRGQSWLSTTSIAARAWAADSWWPNRATSRPSNKPPKGDRIDATGYLIGIGKWSDRTAQRSNTLADDPRRLVAAALNYARIPRCRSRDHGSRRCQKSTAASS